MKITKCDRCRKIFEHPLTYFKFSRECWYTEIPEIVEMCRDCRDSFTEILEKWWGEAQPKKSKRLGLGGGVGDDYNSRSSARKGSIASTGGHRKACKGRRVG